MKGVQDGCLVFDLSWFTRARGVNARWSARRLLGRATISLGSMTQMLLRSSSRCRFLVVMGLSFSIRKTQLRRCVSSGLHAARSAISASVLRSVRCVHFQAPKASKGCAVWFCSSPSGAQFESRCSWLLLQAGRPHDEEWEEMSNDEAQVLDMMQEMQAAGMPGMSMYSRDEIMQQMEQYQGNYEYDDEGTCSCHCIWLMFSRCTFHHFLLLCLWVESCLQRPIEARSCRGMRPRSARKCRLCVLCR